MTNRTINLDPRLHAYLLEQLPAEPAVLKALREETALLPEARMQIAPEQGRFMAWLVALTGARRILEVGTFTGYSALSMALALPAGGRLTALDKSEEWTAIARRHFAAAGVADRVELRIGPALESLDHLLAAGAAESYDFAFIDADKEGYGAYFERCLALLRRGGVIAVDNTLWYGRPADPAVDDADTRAIRAFNQALRADPRVDMTLLPLGDGLSLATRR